MSQSPESQAPAPRKRGRFALGCLGLLVVTCGCLFAIYGGGRHSGPGRITGAGLADEVVSARAARQVTDTTRAGGESRRILFGDLHVHSTFSADAFARSLPIVGGDGAHPPADACDYARYCSQLDFFALTDHAEALTQAHWDESKQSIRDCNARATDPANPDLVAYMGFEWSQVGMTPDTHYGHKNVVFRQTDEAHLPRRAISAPIPGQAFDRPPLAKPWMLPIIPLLDFDNRDRYLDIATYFHELRGMPDCATGVDTRQLPTGCREVAADPRVLFEKLDQWGFDSLVIPHGSTWGFYTPPGYTWDKQLAPENDDPDRQRLVEVYSGHGNSEEYRDFEAYRDGPDGSRICPESTDAYEPCCRRAGEIIRARCGNIPAAECERRVLDAQQAYLALGAVGHRSIPDADAEDWGDCGQCRDCFLPAFNYRPRGSVQYMMARGHFAPGEPPRHARFGFLASSDNHTARPGTGYKETRRRLDTEATGAISETWRSRIFGDTPPARDQALHVDPAELMEQAPFALVDLERQSTFFLTGGLVAVQSTGRDRDSIWEALRERRVYGTSGDRILLWFDLLREGLPVAAMGAEATVSSAPTFRVRAVGAQIEQPGCPEWAVSALGTDRLARLCGVECHNPSDERKPIVRIEVVRIRLQRDPSEDVRALVSDPWRVIPCDGGTSGCTVEFTDSELLTNPEDTLYYVRAIEAASPAVNGNGMRCGPDGQCRPCYGDMRVPASEDCLADVEERAWSSPIWVRYEAPAAVPVEPAPVDR